MSSNLPLASNPYDAFAPFARLYEPLMSKKDTEKWQMTQIKNMKEIQSFYGRGWHILKKKNIQGKNLFSIEAPLPG
jgi:hypothetical protein